MRRNHWGGGFRRHPRNPVTSSQVATTRAQKCKGCGQPIPKAEIAVRLRLKKSCRTGCTTCGHLPGRIKWFHIGCVPADINTAMGYVPGAAPPPTSSGGAVPPPNKPESAEDAALAALVALEHAVLIRAQRKGVTPEMRSQFKTFQAIKARVLRPGTQAEGETATVIALQRIIKLVF